MDGTARPPGSALVAVGWTISLLGLASPLGLGWPVGSGGFAWWHLAALALLPVGAALAHRGARTRARGEEHLTPTAPAPDEPFVLYLPGGPPAPLTPGPVTTGRAEVRLRAGLRGFGRVVAGEPAPELLARARLVVVGLDGGDSREFTRARHTVAPQRLLAVVAPQPEHDGVRGVVSFAEDWTPTFHPLCRSRLSRGLGPVRRRLTAYEETLAADPALARRRRLGEIIQVLGALLVAFALWRLGFALWRLVRHDWAIGCHQLYVVVPAVFAGLCGVVAARLGRRIRLRAAPPARGSAGSPPAPRSGT
ncbi:hypothetical protein ABZ816_00630 [Actinosynnema sp. NPDC047251]|uniref:Putative membrane protein n=1 Tax=Saccharothrix espanaensis (strain ATCC 51144 / DSM 44229 / JCM 9112 / NBRC 15066 / NRRL 15764) TaxID=1179773 RepID=K0K2H2_SACES|nr:hypothetical protein [Saccharothrix espanaensis]CCH30753.1 putative membrane protein [Saccharothrix espanaensis DSM 44229]